MVTASDYGDAEHFDLVGQDLVNEELQHRAYLRTYGGLEAYEAENRRIIEQGRRATEHLNQLRQNRQELAMDFEETGSQAELWEWER